MHAQNRAEKTASKGRVLFWVDTFCENFHPEIAQAAVDVLRHAGYEPVLPHKPMCCGRPLYDFGYLDQARSKLLAILDTYGAEFADSSSGLVGMVGLEPGCLSVFKDEMLKFFPDDARAQSLARKTSLLGDFLVSVGYKPPPLEIDVLVHTHCHQKALFGSKGDQALLLEMGARAQFLDSGCCGMAGSFGFNPEHRDISQAVGEEVLLPAVRRQSQETVILTNGFSCREQIRQGTGREVMHLAELLALAHRTAGEAQKDLPLQKPLEKVKVSAREVAT
jgi:Fe-S oxidoreductase